MVVWMTWLIWAGVLVILEMLTGTFYLLMIAAGFASAGVAAWLGAGSATQYVVAAVIGIFATYVLRRSKYGKASKSNAFGDPNVNMDIGQSISVDTWKTSDDEKSTARVMYRGAMWDVELAKGSTPKAGLFIIREVRGSCLIVSNERRNNV